METINLDGFNNLKKGKGNLLYGDPIGTIKQFMFDGKNRRKYQKQADGKWKELPEEIPNKKPPKIVDNKDFFDIKKLKPEEITSTSTFFKNLKVGDIIHYDDGEGRKFKGPLIGFNSNDQKGRLAFIAIKNPDTHHFDTYTSIDALINGKNIKKVVPSYHINKPSSPGPGEHGSIKIVGGLDDDDINSLADHELISDLVKQNKISVIGGEVWVNESDKEAREALKEIFGWGQEVEEEEEEKPRKGSGVKEIGEKIKDFNAEQMEDLIGTWLARRYDPGPGAQLLRDMASRYDY